MDEKIKSGKNALMVADTRISLVGTTLLQINNTNPGLFDEAIIYYIDNILPKDQILLNSIMPCRFIKYTPPLPLDLFEKPRFKLFSVLMFARFEMFQYLKEFETITWLDTDILIQKDIRELLYIAKKNEAVFIREDDENKTAKNIDRMRTCFISYLPEPYSNDYLYISGTFVLSNKITQKVDYTEWCYKKTIEWADNLSLPDQGVINALIQEFNLKISVVPGNIYACFPDISRNCYDAAIIHSWGANKFWNDWYLFLKYPKWYDFYKQWISIGGSILKSEFKPKISVIIPSYKSNLTLFKECLDSLIEQKRNSWERFSDFEIVIISEPNENIAELKELINSYNDPRFHVEINEKRIGIAASLNKGIRLSNGHYIARMDDDDLSSKYRLYKQSEYLDKYEEITLCTSDFEYFGDMNERRISFDGEMAKAWSIFSCPFDHPTVMFRGNFFIKNNLFYDEQRFYVEDWELWLRAFDAGMKVGCIHEVLFYHRWIRNMSAGQTDKTFKMMLDLVQKNFKKLDIEILNEDLPLISPWNGKLNNDTERNKVLYYFSKALLNNRIKKLYDQKSLERAFVLRLTEIRTGTLPEIVEKIEINTGDKIIMNETNFIRNGIKKFFKPFYRPFRNRFENPIISIQQSNQTIENLLSSFLSNQNRALAQIDHILVKLNVIDSYNDIFDEKLNQINQSLISINNKHDILEENIDQVRQDLNSICNKHDILEENIDQVRQDLNSICNKYDAIGKNNGQIEQGMKLINDKLYDLFKNIRYEQNALSCKQFFERKIILLGTPEHSNIGDAAITLGEIEFLRKYFSTYRLMELSTYDFNEWYSKLSSIINNNDILFLQGGGNLGNKFINEEIVRRKIISDFPSNKIIILPQTIYFDNTEQNNYELAISEEIYNRHEDLTIFTRGTKSLNFARKHFPNARSFISLDMALMLTIDFKLPRKGLLLCIRDLEDESAFTNEEYMFIENTIRRIDSNFTKTNNLYKGEADNNIYKEMRKSVVIDELKNFSKHEVVITDRLHGLIFAIITHTPCVVMSSYNYKIEEFCEIVGYSNAIFFIDHNINILEDAIEKAINIKQPTYQIFDKNLFQETFELIMSEKQVQKDNFINSI